VTAVVFLTADRPGITGSFRATPEDFVVHERLVRPPRGRGAYAWILVEKRGISTPELLRRLGSALRIKANELRAEGFKDAAAVTSQWISLPARVASEISNLEIADVRIVEQGLDDAPLDSSLIESNRFGIRLRNVSDGAASLALARASLAELTRRGVPNFYGAQRFGVRGESAAVGAALLQGRPERAVDWLLGTKSALEHDPRAATFRDAYQRGDFAAALEHCPGALRLERKLLELLTAGRSKRDVARAIPPQEQRFFASAWQALLFNRVLALRLGANALDVPLRGDLVVDDAGRLDPILDPASVRGDVGGGRKHPTAPLFGERVALALGVPGEWEATVLRAAGYESIAAFRSDTRFPFTLKGDRRPVRVIPRDVTVSQQDSELFFEFTLPSGAFATTLLSEITKQDAPPLAPPPPFEA
jgi:tRNA pseudouridine13 synthase